MKLESDTNIKDDFGGTVSIKLKQGRSIEEYCKNNVENYNPDRFEVLAIRCYYGKETIVTLYAIDKQRMEGNNFSKDKMPVQKFKLKSVFIKNLLPFIDECNFTLTTGNYPLAEMEIINK